MSVTMLGGGMPGVSPDDIAGLQAWWRSDIGVEEGPGDPAEDTDNVTKWLDQSGNSRDLASGVSPQYLTGIVNGLPVLRFVNTSSEALSTVGHAMSTMITASAGTVFMVLNVSLAGSGIFYADDNISGQNAVAVDVDGAQDLRSINWDGSNDIIAKASSNGVWVVHTWIHSGGSVFSGVSDTRNASLASTPSGNTSVLTQVLNLGRSRGAFGSFDIAEMFIYNTVIVEADRQSLETRMGFKYGISLPY